MPDLWVFKKELYDSIYIQDSRNNIGHPTTKCDMIGRLLRNGKAKITKRLNKDIIVVQLLTKIFNISETVECEFRIGVDPGYTNIGFAIFKIYNNKVVNLFKGEAKLRTPDIKDNLDTRRMYRRQRRYHSRKNVKRKFGVAKFKHPIWKNRKKHKLQPTHIFLIKSHIHVLRKILKLVPQNQVKIHIEYNKFDLHKITKPNIKSFWYQKGDKYGFENTKSYVRNRDNYQCQICKKYVGNLPNEVHHIMWKQNGGSDRHPNLILLCPKCHAKVHSHKVSCPTKSVSVNKYRDAGVLNSCMPYIWRVLENSSIPIQETFGYITNYNRRQMKLEKTHANDAYIIAFCDSLGVQEFDNYKYVDSNIVLNMVQHRRHVRTFTQRHEDRKYYIVGDKKIVAWNRNRRTGQDKKKQSLTELKQHLIDNNNLNKVQIVAKPGRRIMRRSNRDMLFRPGDIVKHNNTYSMCRGWASTQRRVLFTDKSFAKQKDCIVVRHNSGIGSI